MYQRADGIWADTITINGKKKSFYSKSKAELKRKIAAYNVTLESGVKMETAISDWLEDKRQSVDDKTVEGYQAPIKRINKVFGNTPVKEITPAQIQAFINDLVAQGYKRTAVQRPLDVMRMVFDHEMIKPDSTMKFNPCSGVRLPSGLKQECRELASREDIALVEAGADLPFGLYAYMIMYTGLRDNELLALTDEDFEGDWISVTKSLQWKPNKGIIKLPKTENGIRQVYIHQPLRDKLPKWNGYLFSADGGKSPLTQTEYKRRWCSWCRAAGLADAETVQHKSKGQNNRTYQKTIWHNRIVPYQLRHEYATLCFDAGLDAKVTASLMGHASEETTKRIYTHILESRRSEDINKLEEFVVRRSKC